MKSRYPTPLHTYNKLTYYTGFTRRPLLITNNPILRNKRTQSPRRLNPTPHNSPNFILLIRLCPPLQILHHPPRKTRLPRPPSRPPPHLSSSTLRPNCLCLKRPRIPPCQSKPPPTHRPRSPRNPLPRC